MVPISILLLFVMRVFFDRGVESPGELAMGMAAAIVGLSMFIDALRVCVMPLSEQLGTELPKTLSLPYVLAIAGFLGVLVTYAEPAITTLRPLAELVDIEVAPYLYCILMVSLSSLSSPPAQFLAGGLPQKPHVCLLCCCGGGRAAPPLQGDFDQNKMHA